VGLEDTIKAQALGSGFDLVGIARLGPAETAEYFDRWLAAGRAGAMGYLSKKAELRRDSRLPYDGARSAIMVGLDYGGREPPGPIARYARGDDYHEVMWARLNALQAWLSQQVGRDVRGRGFVDTGPILERDLARRAGLGWFGKNTNLINPKTGSFFFIGALLVDLELEPDAPFEADRCGTCTACLDACPTHAFVGPRELDAQRCISYLTIEVRGSIDKTLREAIGANLYGCDICQDVCPWNERFSQSLHEDAFRSRPANMGTAQSLARAMLSLDEARYRIIYRGSAMKRAKLEGLRRNAAVVLGNIGDVSDIPLLESVREAATEVEREHIDWALGQLRARVSR
jgi:epoxyqueuosine reductase